MVKHVAASKVYGFWMVDGFNPFETPYTPPAPPTPFRSQPPWMDPFPSDHFINVPVGSGITLLPTSDPQHIQLLQGNTGNINFNNWTNPEYLATNTDPLNSVSIREFLPAGWQTLANTASGPAAGAGAEVERYDNVRVPSAAAWQSSTNTDRKVIVYEPTGRYKRTIHKFYRTTTAGLIYGTNHANNDVVYGYGMMDGAIASGIDAVGSIRGWEIQAVKAGDKFAIRHALQVGLPDAKLKVGPQWPARTQDSNAASVYTGLTPYGTHIVLPMSVNVEALMIGSVPFNTAQKAIAYACQRFGSYVLIRSGSGPLSYSIEPRQIDSTVSLDMKAALAVLVPLMRIATNSTYDSSELNLSNRQPFDTSRIGGPGTRVTAGLGLTDMDNTTGYKLPINPDPASWV